MMATYFNGGSEIQADHLQTLYLMNPSYAATYSDAQQHLVGIPLAQSGSGTQGADLSRPSSFHEIPGSAAAGGPSFHYNIWGVADPSSSGGRAQNQIPTAFSVSELGSPMGFCRGPSNQGLSLCLKNSSPAHTNTAAALSPGGGGSLKSASGVSVGVGGSPQSLILGSKYLKATQELLDEVVSMADSGASGVHREKEKEKATAKAEISSDEDGASKGGVCELSSAQRQELQMKKAKLLNMLDEVEQRYKQYQMQMHRVGSELEQAAGLWSAKSYTSLALHTISKQFRCLKDAIASQVKETGRRMGEVEDEKEGRSASTSTRHRMVEQQLRQQRAMQQLGMMHNQHNAWRPQRGLPERAVSVLRAWLFEHFLHPYPKDLDKHMLAKQTGLTRSQVSNWFINARVRLWKPMVEEMYVEEMKGAGHNQNDSDEANTTTNNNDPNKEYSSLTQKSTPPLQSHNHMSNPKQPPPPPPNNSIINDIPNSTLVSPSSGPTSGPTLHPIGPDLSLIRPSSSGMESIFNQRSPKRQRNSVLNIHSPSSILSMDMKDDPNNNRDLFTTPDGGFGPNNYPVSDHIRSRFSPDNPHHQLGQSQYHHHAGNAVSLTLGLPHCENMLSLSGTHHHQQNFFSGHAMQLGGRLDMGEPEWCGSQPGPHSDAGGGSYEGSVDTQTGKRFAAQLLPDFVA